jgi:hypothetical protein
MKTIEQRLEPSWKRGFRNGLIHDTNALPEGILLMPEEIN